MHKNLFIFHLENMSQSMFWHFHPQLPTLWKMRGESTYYAKCYSSGTSTIFPVNSISYGSTCGVDHLESAVGAWEKDCMIEDKPLFPLLNEKYGYETLFFNADNRILSGRIHPMNKMLQFEHELWYFQDDSATLSKFIKEKSANGAPLAAFFATCCDLGHPTWRPRNGHRFDNSVDMQKAIISDLDSAVKVVLDVLHNLDLANDSLILFFGDHGFGTYNAGNKVRYKCGTMIGAEASWVPLFIHGDGFGVEICDDLVSLDDIRSTILGSLFPEDAFPPISLPFPGIDVTKDKRVYAFSQNKFALQNENDRDMDWPKSYSVTDGKLRLETSTPKWKEKAGGLRLFIDQCDPGNNFDMLDAFILNAQGKIVGINRDVLFRLCMRGRHFLTYFNPEFLGDLARRYTVLRRKLIEYVREKERYAIARLGRHSDFILPETAFTTSEAMMQRKTFSTTPDRIMPLLSLERPLCLFGAGKFGRETLVMLREVYNCTPDAFIDNRSNSFSEGLDGINVLSPDQAADGFPDAVVIGCTGFRTIAEEMRAQCAKLSLEYHSMIGDIFGFEYIKD